MTSRRIGLLLGAIVLAGRGDGGAAIGPRLNKPAIVVDYAPADFLPIAVTGSGLGTAGTLTVFGGPGVLEIDSTRLCGTNPPPCIVFWKDQEVVAEVPRSVSRPVLRARPGSGGFTNSARADRYRLTTSSLDPGPGQIALPFGGVVDAQGDVWVHGEDHTRLDRFDVDARDPDAPPVLVPLLIPVPATSTFYYYGFGCPDGCLNNTSMASEDFLALGKELDPKGRVWLIQGGAPERNPITFPNHHRVLSYSTVDGSWQFYNLPGDDDGAEGLAWDAPRKQLWLTAIESECGSVVMTPARLIRFNPDDHANPPNDGTVPFPIPVPGTCSLPPVYDCPPSGNCTCPSAPGVCLDGSNRNCFADSDCTATDQICGFVAGVPPPPACRFVEYPLPGVFWPAHLAVDRSGFVWFAEYYLANRIGRLDPDTGAVDYFPLPLARNPTFPGTYFAGVSMPWDLRIDKRGSIAITETLDNAVSRIDPRLLGRFDCHQLDGNGQNPCFTEFPSPTDDPTSNDDGGPLTLTFDRSGNTWFTQMATAVGSASPQTVGYVRNWKYVVMFPPLSLLDTGGGPCSPAFGSMPAFEGGGIGTGVAKNDVWTTDACRRQLVRLQKQ